MQTVLLSRSNASTRRIEKAGGDETTGSDAPQTRYGNEVISLDNYWKLE